MTISARNSQSVARKGLAFIAALLFGMVLHFDVQADPVTINVVGPDGTPITSGFRWLVEEDTTYDVLPGYKPGPFDPKTLSLTFHTSYAPVVTKGTSANNVAELDPFKRYFVSVLPDSGYAMSGAPIVANQTEVTVTVQPLPIPTAQISVFVYNDNEPINNAPDAAELARGLADFTIILTEAGGRYGHNGGQVSQDVFGNPLGTTYNPDGSPDVMGSGVIKTGANGVVVIKNLAPGKYGVTAVPPAGSDWHQTHTIEGTKTIDAWVKANEPSFFVEFGPPGHHAFIGFVNTLNDATVLNGSSTVSGRVVNLHTARPPDFAFFDGHPMPNCWVGLNELQTVGGRGVYTTPCNADSTFSIPNVPPGTYQLVIWDEYMDTIFAMHNVTVPAAGDVDLQDVSVFNWFNRLESTVFFDANGNGFRDEGEQGIPEQAVNLRFRDGSIYQSFPTDTAGYVPFDEVFPFFHWLIAEVDFLRFKATGATVIVDAGGEVPPDAGWDMPSLDKLNPQPQFETDPFTGEATTTPLIGPAGNNLSRTETGPVLTQAFQGFLGQTNVIEWGKGLYVNGENGGISGIVYYATTRAEDDPRYAAAETWEPGIPRVQVNLYQDFNRDGIIDDVDGSGGVTLADVDNHPFGFQFGEFPGPEDNDRDGNFSFDQGDAVQVVSTDSFDDNLPTGCQGEQFVSNSVATDCFDGLRNFNQVRPGVFDGGYAFNGIPAGTYIVEAVPPPGYELVKEEDKNVDFGDTYVPSPLALPQLCVGDQHIVPAELTLMPGVPAFYAGQSRPLCDRKQVTLANRQNAAADFFLFTEVPVAAHVVGFVLDDLANEFDPNAPTFGEKYAPPFLPVSFRDWTGREITRVYTDEWGKYNALLPSTYSVNIPTPSGVSASMLTACINSPTKPDPLNPGRVVVDPFFNRQYSQFCYTFQYMPGTTTYLDTPVLPIAAFAGPGQFPLDCEMTDGTPIMYTVSRVGPTSGPWIPNPPINPNNAPVVEIVSSGIVEVPNPGYDGTEFTQPTIFRDFGFGGTQGTVTLTYANGTVQNLPVVSWSDGAVRVRVPRPAQTGQLTLTRGDNGKSTRTGITLTVAGPQPIAVPPGGSIQAAIDAAPQGALIMPAPGNYEELLVMHKRVRLQGWGAPATTINAVKAPAEKLQAWRTEINNLFATNQFTLLPGQALGFDIPNNEPALFNAEEGAGITVVANPTEFGTGTNNNLNFRARIDGFTITGADHGGAIFVNGYARNLSISNNRIVGNAGTFGGGIRIGNPYLVVDQDYTDNDNDNAHIHHNHIAQNGGLGGAGGGISLATGANNYRVTQNHVCGNFTTGDGGGIGHIGRSTNGLIENNTVLFNQSFNQGTGVSGGGISISGLPSVAPGALTPGSGRVTINSNLIQGNLAGAGDGGGIRLQFVNGQDIVGRANNPAQWDFVNVLNNMIVNNVAGMAGGGISLQDVARSSIIHNTVANNDSTATAGAAFAPGSSNESTPQPAGIVSRAHSTLLTNTIGNGVAVQPFKQFANPVLLNNIVWHNRSFYFTIDTTVLPSFYTLLPDVGAGEDPVYADLAVLGTATPQFLRPQFSILTDITDYPGANNFADDPNFVAEYTNGDTSQVVIPEVTSGLAVQPAFDEGGNFIDVRFGPLTLVDPNTGLLFGDYHIQPGSPTLARGNFFSTSQYPQLIDDFDGERRANPLGSRPDVGADERANGAAPLGFLGGLLNRFRR